MKIGFTGTRHGMTDAQRTAVNHLLSTLTFTESHHGAAIGADEQFATAVRVRTDARIVAHPCNITSQQSELALKFSDVALPVDFPLTRNHAIVDSSDLMLACPAEAGEVLRSGTWATVRYARKVGKPLWLVLPDGEVVREDVRK